MLEREPCKIDTAVEETLFFDIFYRKIFLKFKRYRNACMKY